METIETSIKGLLLIKNKLFSDNRGGFLKIFNEDFYKDNLLCTNLKECYFSISHKNVIRGMHFQIPPAEHEKIVYVSNGSIIDVVVDIRANSGTYGQYCSFNLSDTSGEFLYIPKGCAHGFLSLNDNTVVNYIQTSVYNSACDCGIRYDSFGFDWGVEKPIISDRDLSFPSLSNFKSPF